MTTPTATPAAGVAVATPALPLQPIPRHPHHPGTGSAMATPTKTQIAQRLAELQPTRNAMAAAMLAYFQAHVTKTAEIDAAKAANKQARATSTKASPMPAPLPPMGVKATVGLGKTQATAVPIEAAHAAGLPIVILVPNHKLTQEYFDRLKPFGAVVYQGRREPAQGEPNGPPVDPGPHACYRLVQVAKAGDQNHSPAQGLCHQCPNGAAGVLKFVTRDEMRRQRAEQFFKTSGIDPASVPPCQFLYKGLPDQLAAPILIAPIQAFSEAMADWREADLETGFPLREIQRLIIVDEHIPMAQEVEIVAGDIKVWRNRLDALIERLDRSITALQNKQAPTQAETDELDQVRAMRNLIPEIDILFRDLGSKIAGDVPIGIDAQRVVDMQKKVAKAGASVAGTAAWEKVSYVRDEDDFFIPLRALSTLARNCKSGTMRQEKGTMFAYETSPVVEWARDKGSVMFLDATMSQAMRQFITKMGGHVHDATASQNMRVTRVTGRLYSRGDVRKADYPTKARARMAEIQDLIAPKMLKPGAMLTHKAYLRYSQEAHQADGATEAAAQEFEAQTGAPIGWFGRHDRGLDTWGGRHLALVGMPLLSKESIAGLYACVRAAMADCGIPLPEWDGVMDKEKADADGPPMPVMPEVRAWLIDEYAQGMAQAIGRSRAVNHPRGCKPLQVTLWGGLQTAEMDAALRKYGVVIHDRIRNPRSISGPKPDLGAVDEAISMALAAGGGVSIRSVRSALVGLRRSASTDAISTRIRELRAVGTIPAAARVRRDDAPAAEAPTELVAAASVDIHAEAAAIAAIEPDAVERQVEVGVGDETQRQGQEKMVVLAAAALESVPSHTETTVPNSHKDTNKGNSVQCNDTPAEAGQQGQDKIFFAPPSLANNAGEAMGEGDEGSWHRVMNDLLSIAAGIEVQWAQEGDPDDPDDDPASRPGGRRQEGGGRDRDGHRSDFARGRHNPHGRRPFATAASPTGPPS